MKRIALAIAIFFACVLPAFAAPNDPRWTEQWGLRKVGVEGAWSSAKGDGIVIAVVDTGIDLLHEDIAGKLVAGRDFVTEGGNSQDRNGHGTHVSGIAAAWTFNGKGVAGVAPNAKLMPVRVLNEFGLNIEVSADLLTNVAEGIRWAVDNGAHVINLSLGPVAGEGPDPETADAIRYAWSKGVVCVVAAGNDDGAESGYTDQPGIVVVATRPNDALAGYSNVVGKARWGIAAPGGRGALNAPSEDILSTYFEPIFAADHRSYEYLAGTSMATPHVAGAAALLRSRGLSPQQTVDRIIATAQDLGSPGYDSIFGAGLLNAADAAAVGADAPGSGASGGGAAGGGAGSTRGSSTGPNLPAASEGGITPANPQTSAGEKQDPSGAVASSEHEPEGESGSSSWLLLLLVLLAALGGGAVWFLRSGRSR